MTILVEYDHYDDKAADQDYAYFDCLWVPGAEAYHYVVVVVLREMELIIAFGFRIAFRFGFEFV